jgi:hypothetical protein
MDSFSPVASTPPQHGSRSLHYSRSAADVLSQSLPATNSLARLKQLDSDLRRGLPLSPSGRLIRIHEDRLVLAGGRDGEDVMFEAPTPILPDIERSIDSSIDRSIERSIDSISASRRSYNTDGMASA